jgi:hypothetical protein
LWCAAVVTLTMSCGRIDFATREDARGDAPALPKGKFTLGPSLEVVGSDPQVRTDQREIWVSRQVPVTYQLSFATRAGAGTRFSMLTVAGALDSSASETDPSLTENGLEILFVSDRTGASRLYRSTRETPELAFTGPAVVSELDFNIRSATLVGDTTLYVIDAATGSLKRATRPGVDAPFDPPEDVSAPTMGWPTIAVDELELFGNLQPAFSGVVWAERAQREDAFVMRERLDLGGACTAPQLADPQLSHDGHKLWITCGGVVYEASR